MMTYRGLVNNTLVNQLARPVRIWRILVIANVIALPILAALFGAEYHWITLEAFRPPYYSIWVGPSQTRHHVEFIMSPWRKVLMTVDGEVVTRL
jgi:hypothetical protein